MKNEYEVKFLNIDIKSFKNTIKDLNAEKKHKMVLYKRYTFDLPNNKGFIRIRKEYKKTTLTLKSYTPESKYAKEIEIELNSSLEDAKNFLIELGYTPKSYQETIREKWMLGKNKEIVLDIVPGLPPFIEIECKTEKDINNVISKLKLNKKDAVYSAYSGFYKYYYGFDETVVNKKIPSLTFENVDKELEEYILKNKDLLKTIKLENLKIYKKLK